MTLLQVRGGSSDHRRDNAARIGQGGRFLQARRPLQTQGGPFCNCWSASEYHVAAKLAITAGLASSRAPPHIHDRHIIADQLPGITPRRCGVFVASLLLKKGLTRRTGWLEVIEGRLRIRRSPGPEDLLLCGSRGGVDTCPRWATL